MLYIIDCIIALICFYGIYYFAKKGLDALDE